MLAALAGLAIAGCRLTTAACGWTQRHVRSRTSADTRPKCAVGQPGSGGGQGKWTRNGTRCRDRWIGV